MSIDTIAVLLLAGLLALIVILYKRGNRLIAPILAALVAGPVCYFCVGILVPRITGEGRFFSVPFGGFHVGDLDILFSVLAWSLASWALFRFIAVLRRRGSPLR
ncbi:MAG TPA: hypothetical protein VK572_07435 [Burkholderiales bacterium]|nr:hypothetical protein [Burkholderiales bacterium]